MTMNAIMTQKGCLFQKCQKALESNSIEQKPKLVLAIYQEYLFGNIVIRPKHSQLKIKAGFPPDLDWVAPSQLKHRKLTQPIGRAALIHAVCHIEFNAINLALDAICRFSGLPEKYYVDWLKVAAEEAYHFSLLRQHLINNQYDYGYFPVHNGLWKMAEETAYDPMVRMACVPRLLEARGLDVAPLMAKKLKQNNDEIGAGLLGIIFQDEIEHVRVGNRWYAYFCALRDIPPLETFRTLVQKHAPEFLRGPYNAMARLEAGFRVDEMKFLEEEDAKHG
tara:strand:- start:66282 stop:67115 length:834 start_codon:yes stop_codon:yes gene_type:complete